MSNHTPRHATAQLALRTVTAVAATLILAVSLGSCGLRACRKDWWRPSKAR